MARLTPWLDIARGEIGQVELAGPSEHNARILEYLETCDRDDGGNLGPWAMARDETPWCSAFVNWCMLEAGCTGTNDARAISWLDWGLEIEDPLPGCVAIIRRRRSGADARTGSSSGNHVAFLDKTLPAGVQLLGGNQRNSVKISRYSFSKYETLGYRMPSPDMWAAPYTA